MKQNGRGVVRPGRPVAGGCVSQKAEVVGTIVNPEIKMNGVAWDGENIWVTTYQSNSDGVADRAAGRNGAILSSFPVAVKSLDDVHNLGMSNITCDGADDLGQPLERGDHVQLRQGRHPPEKFRSPLPEPADPGGDRLRRGVPVCCTGAIKPCTGWTGTATSSGRYRFASWPRLRTWAWRGTGRASGSAARAPTASCASAPEGDAEGCPQGAQGRRGVRDLAWDGEHLLVVYSQDSTVYKLTITE